MYKIVSTTDGKNVGLEINITNKIIELRSGFKMIPTKISKSGKEALISNSNYIINAIKL